eukprot:2324708-Pleurochrysis_carterae.AAC.4
MEISVVDHEQQNESPGQNESSSREAKCQKNSWQVLIGSCFWPSGCNEKNRRDEDGKIAGRAYLCPDAITGTECYNHIVQSEGRRRRRRSPQRSLRCRPHRLHRAGGVDPRGLQPSCGA